LIEDRGVVEAEPGFDGEWDFNGVAEGAENGVDLLRLAKESAAGALSIDDGSGAAEVQIDAGDGMLLEFARGADEVGDAIADHLRDDGAAGGIASDGREDVGFEMRIGADAEILGPVDVGAAVGRHELPEGEVRDVLHGGESEDGLGAGEKGMEGRWVIQKDFEE